MAANTFQKFSITVEAAQRMIAAAEAKASEMGRPMCIAVCDGDGTLKAFSRMDGAPLLSVQIAQDKAYTDRKSTRLNSSHTVISYAVFCLKKKTITLLQDIDTSAGE